MENYLAGLSVGMGVWLIAWGFNRVYLMFKKFVS